MSTHQQLKPRCANQSITDESGRPGTVRSKVGCDAIDDPCTNSTAGLPCGESTNFSHRNRRTSPSAVFLWVQCSWAVMDVLMDRMWVVVWSTRSSLIQLGAGGLD